MWQIDKTFDFCYSHRVYVQRLNIDYCSSGDTACACRHIHGHQGKVHVFLESETLDDRAMVVDFKEIGFMKDFIDGRLDHKFIIDAKDPMFGHLVDGTWNLVKQTPIKFTEVLVPGTSYIAGRVIDLSSIADLEGTPEYEVLEGFFIIDFIPTSENLSEWLHTIAQVKLDGLGVKVTKVEFWETPKSRSTFIRG
jgi:6-pyruvoyltetrahydropterin/6-carboxytetrahydropterin synthase